MKLAGAALDNYVDGGTAGNTLLSVERVGGDINGLDGVCGGNVRDQIWQPAVGVNRAIDAGGVTHTLHPVDVDRHGPRRVGRGRVLLYDVGCTGYQRVQGLKVASLGGRDGQFRKLRLSDIVIYFCIVSLKHGRGGIDCYFRTDAGELQLNGNASLLVDADDDVFLSELGEAADRVDDYAVGPRLQIADRIFTIIVG